MSGDPMHHQSLELGRHLRKGRRVFRLQGGAVDPSLFLRSGSEKHTERFWIVGKRSIFRSVNHFVDECGVP